MPERLVFYPRTPPLKQAGWRAGWSPLRRLVMCYLTAERRCPSQQHTHRHSAMLLEDFTWPRDCPLVTGHREGNWNWERCQPRKRKLPLGPQLPAQNSYTSACRVLIHYSMFLIHYKLHLNFLAHVHLWDILILSSFFMYRASKKRISKCNILLRNKLTAQFRVNFTAQWSERDLAAGRMHLEGGLRRGLVLMGPLPCLRAK